MRPALLVSSSWTLLHAFFIVLPLAAATATTQQQPTPSATQPSRVQQSILHPASSDVLTPGGTFTIEWKADPHFQNITLEIWDKTSWGYSREFGDLCYHWTNPFCGTIASHAPNTGSFQWQIPKPGSEFPRGERVFWIKMYVDDYLHPEIGNNDPVLSYSQNFCFAPEPGQAFSLPPVSTQTGDSSGFQTPIGTITVTVHDGPSATYRGTASTTVALPLVTNASTSGLIQQTGLAAKRPISLAIKLFLTIPIAISSFLLVAL